jgi:hypothetical protein
MKKVIILVGIVLILIIAGLVFYGLKNPKNGIGTLNSSGDPIQTGSAANIGSDLTSTMPSDAPKGDAITIQGSRGVVSLKNFYKTAAGYWREADAIAVARGSNWTDWYYRASGSFEIRLAPAATPADQKAGETALLSALGVDAKTGCGLSVSVGLPVDGGMSYEPSQPGFCASPAF